MVLLTICRAFVTFCDINEEKGRQLEDELSS